jgi:hypothetical protein
MVELKLMWSRNTKQSDYLRITPLNVPFMQMEQTTQQMLPIEQMEQTTQRMLPIVQMEQKICLIIQMEQASKSKVPLHNVLNGINSSGKVFLDQRILPILFVD